MRFLRMGVVVVCLIFLVIHFQQKQQETSVLFPATVEGLTGAPMGAASAIGVPVEPPTYVVPAVPRRQIVSPDESSDVPVAPPHPLEDVPALRRKSW